MATQENNINISPTQLMVFTFAMVALMMAMAYIITNTVVNGQVAHAAQQTNTASPQYVVSPNGAGTCSEPAAKTNDDADMVGDQVMLNGRSYTVVGVVPATTKQINEDNDTTVTNTTTIDNRNRDNTSTDNRNSGNTDNRHSGNKSTDNRDSGNTSTDNRNSGNTNVDNRNQGNTSTDNRNSGNSSTTKSTTNTTTTTVDNRNQGNTTDSGNSNAQNNGNTTNSGNSVSTEENNTTITRRFVTNNSLF